MGLQRFLLGIGVLLTGWGLQCNGVRAEPAPDSGSNPGEVASQHTAANLPSLTDDGAYQVKRKRLLIAGTTILGGGVLTAALGAAIGAAKCDASCRDSDFGKALNIWFPVGLGLGVAAVGSGVLIRRGNLHRRRARVAAALGLGPGSILITGRF